MALASGHEVVCESNRWIGADAWYGPLTSKLSNLGSCSGHEGGKKETMTAHHTRRRVHIEGEEDM